MRTIRRLYYYAIAFISMEVVLWGLIGLTRSAFTSGTMGGGVTRLAQALSLILVGIPVFGLHWISAQRAAAKDMEEHASGIRALFLYAALLVTLIPAVQNLMALLSRLLLQVFNLSPWEAIFGGGQTWSDNLIAAAMNGIVAVYFVIVLRNDWKAITPKDTFADLRRIYRYIWFLYALVMTISGIQQILRFILTPASIFGTSLLASFANGLTLLMIGTPLWYFAWKTCQDSLHEPAEGESLLRLGILYALALAGVITVTASGGVILDVLLRRALGETMTFLELYRQVSGVLSLGIPLGGVWAYYGRWLHAAMAGTPDAPRRAGMRRLYHYILSIIGAIATFSGLSMLLSFTLDMTLGNLLWADTMRPRLAASLATLIAGLPLWWAAWRPMQVEALASGDSGDHARRSTVRKSYLYLALFACVIGGMVTAAGLLFIIISAMLGDSQPDFLLRLIKLLGMLLLYVLFGIYHGSALRRDGKMASEALAAKHAGYPVVICDPGDGNFAQAILSAIQKQAPRLPVTLHPISKPMPKRSAAFKAAILPGDVALNPPETTRLWLHRFSGKRVVVPRAAPGWVWSGETSRTFQAVANQTALVVRQLAEGQEIRQKAPTSGWMVALNICAALFGLEVILVILGSLVSLFAD